MKLPGVVALFLLLSGPAQAHLVAPDHFKSEASPTCTSDSYVNSRGQCVHRPVHSNRTPAGATAKCRDGTFSFSRSRHGTCSHHGGVATWL